ncbi:hypothetical protein CVT24_002501 [Panaeolus cyanescens]|uniref:Uncharacterized protein n=1 Tax=Panaeolus cyanescens TaxID=181874 RepID=A0A409WPN6_9AGAR|nr:hypothetical protein CVT24_002501 [Panaeolus cyanescens]
MYIYNSEFRLGSNVLTASSTLLVLDYLLTLDEEVHKLHLVAADEAWLLALPRESLFAFRRHFHGLVLPNGRDLARGMLACGLCVSELILLLRTFAMWQRARKIFILLAVMSTVTWGPGIAITYMEINSFEFGSVPEGGVGCRLVSASRLIWVTFILLAVSETVVCGLTLIKGMQHLRSSSRSWVRHVYRHGLLFYVYLLIITLANMIVPLISTQPLYKNYLAIPQRVFHSIFCNRVVLLIQGQRSRRTYGSMELTGQHTVTKNNLTGNIDTGVNTDLSRQFGLNELRSGDVMDNGRGNDLEMDTYTRDWTT